MSKQVYKFGRKSFENAQEYVQSHPGKSLIILKDSKGKFAVCNSQMAQELKTKGFQQIDSKE
jgi:hypothetical protein